MVLYHRLTENYRTLGVFHRLTMWTKMPTSIWINVWIINITQKKCFRSKSSVDRFCPHIAYTAFRWTKLHGSFRVKPNYCFFSLLANDGTREVLNLDSSWCALQKSEELYSTRSSDLDHIERLVQCLGKYHINKRGDVKDSKIWVQ